jgi:hypothetical protein
LPRTKDQSGSTPQNESNRLVRTVIS